jgi:hypothetical protein
MNRLDFARAEYHALRERLKADDPELDEQTLADTVEGLTDLHEIIAAILRSALTDEALSTGLKERIDEMQQRQERLAQRATQRRQIARSAMADAAIKTITAPDLTASLRPGSRGLVVVDEAAIPPPYWEPRPPRLNRQALLGELRQGSTVPGVTLSNPEPVLSIRTK